MTTEPFSAHAALLDTFLRERRTIVDRIESTLLNVRGKPLVQSRERAVFERLFRQCFYGLPGLSREQVALQGRLHASHVADGFEPVQLDRYASELDPLELIVRAYEWWERHRWPGSSGRTAFAQTLFAVFVLRELEWLSLRVWDDDPATADMRLADVQRLLDRLNASGAPSAMIRDARWLMQIAQAPLTRHLAPYFRIARLVDESFSEDTRIEIHRAGACLAGGHLRSQLRYRVWTTGRPIDDPENLAVLRNSNSMDGALLLWDLVPLLEAYQSARDDGREDRRLQLADAILQGLAADPELFLLRLDLLAPSTCIEDVFLEGDRGERRLSAIGRTHRDRHARYVELVGDLAEPLLVDLTTIPDDRARYSPFGITYGFCTDVLFNMAMDTLVGSQSHGIALDDLFNSRGDADAQLARTSAWTQLPRRAGERNHFDHAMTNAAEHLDALTAALDTRRRRPLELNASGRPAGSLLLFNCGGASPPPLGRSPRSLHARGFAGSGDYCVTTDPVVAASGRAELWPLERFICDRMEGRYLASAEIDGHWFGVSKVILTLVLAQGRDAALVDLPGPIVETLRITCGELVQA